MKAMKKIVALLSAVCIGSTMIQPVYAQSVNRGDVNGDDKVNITDVVMLASHVKSIKSLDNKHLTAADYNNDGKVNITDLTMLAAQVKNIKSYISDVDTIYSMIEKFIEENELEATANIEYCSDTGEDAVFIDIDGSAFAVPISHEREQRRGDPAWKKIKGFIEDNNIDEDLIIACILE